MATSNRFVSRHGLDNNNNTIQNVADPVNAQDAATKASSSNASNLTTGTLPAARLPAFTGDASVAVGTSTITLSNSGATAGTYKSVTVDAKGRVTAGTNPTSLAGYGITDAAASNHTHTNINNLITLKAVNQPKVALGSPTIDLSVGNFFTYTVTGAVTFGLSNTPANGTLASFILEITNGGSFSVSWMSNAKWGGGTAPTLTASGRDVIGFYTHDGGATWTGLLLGKDVK